MLLLLLFLVLPEILGELLLFGKVFKMPAMNALDAEAEALLMAVKYAAHIGFHS